MRWTSASEKGSVCVSVNGSRRVSGDNVSTTEVDLTLGPFQNLSDVLLRLATSPRPFHRFSPFQVLNAAPALLTEASLTGHPISAHKVAELLLGGINDPSIDVRIEALKAMRGVLHEGMMSEERAAFGPGLVEAAFHVGQAD